MAGTGEQSVVTGASVVVHRRFDPAACWEGRSQVCDEIRLTLAEVRRRTPSAVPAWGPRGTTPRLTVRGTAAGAPPPPPPPPGVGTVYCTSSTAHCPQALGQCIA